MKRLVITLFVASLFLFSAPSFAIWEGVNKLPSWDDYVKEHPNRGREQIEKMLQDSAKSDWKRIIRSQPEVFDMTIDGKTRECYYEGKNIICE